MKEFKQQVLNDINDGVNPIIAAICLFSGIALGIFIIIGGVHYGYQLVNSML